ALVGERALDVPVPQLVVRDARAAMAPAAYVCCGEPTRELEVAGATGTSGKTTTSFLLFAIVAAAGRRPGLLGTVEARVGGERRGVVRTTPEAIDLQRVFREMLDAGDRSCAMEASSHASALGRLEGTHFAALVFTNLSQDHLDFHRDMEDYFEAKRRLFLGGAPAAVNIGDPYGRRLAAELDGAVTFGLGAVAAVRPGALENVLRSARELGPGRLVCVFGCGGDRDRGKRPLMGRIATELADRVIVTSDNPRSEDPQAIIHEILEGAPRAEVEPDRAVAIALALSDARDGDVVVIAGKGNEQGQEIGGRMIPFDDREVAVDVLRRLREAA